MRRNTPTVEPGLLVTRVADELDHELLLAAPWSAGLPEKHADRLRWQARDEAAYLLALFDGQLIGHLFLKWDGPFAGHLTPHLPACAEVEDFVVDPFHRSRGVGTRLLDLAEDLTRERNLAALGLGVGIDNRRAQSLYARVGFRRAFWETFDVTWPYRDRQGRLAEGRERCWYLVKVLR